MKKILLLVISSLITFLFLPAITKAAVMEITVSITSLIVPERTSMVKSAGYPNTELSLDYSRLTIVRRDGGDGIVKNTSFFPYDIAEKNSSVTVSFVYDSVYTYDVYVETQVSKSSGNSYCEANCNNVLANDGWYASYGSLLYNYSVTGLSGSISCPTSLCTGGYQNRIAFPSTSVRGYVDYGDDGDVNTDLLYGTSWYFWRSPSLFTID